MNTSAPATCPFHTAATPHTEAQTSRNHMYRTLSDLPGPDGLPLLGNLLQLDLKQLHTVVETWAGVYGPLYKFQIAHKPVVAVSDTDLINEVLRKRPAA